MLDAHDWDDDKHRRDIHQAFDEWLQAYQAGARQHAGRIWMRFEKLIQLAELRRLDRDIHERRMAPAGGVAPAGTFDGSGDAAILREPAFMRSPQADAEAGHVGQH